MRLPEALLRGGYYTGIVIDDDPTASYDSGSWDSAGNIYSYHGLHYDKRTNEVYFKVKGLTAGCQISIGVTTQVPNSPDNPNTSEKELRMDFYNNVLFKEDKTSGKSNTTHNYIFDELTDEDEAENDGSVTKSKVTYSVAQGCDSFAPMLPEEREYVNGSKVSLEAELPNVGDFVFDGWTINGSPASDFTIDDNVSIVGTCHELTQQEKDDKEAAKHTVTYEIDGEAPEGYKVPKEKAYEEGDLVTRDSLAAGDKFRDYKFLGWESTDVTPDSDNQFLMPNADVKFTGKWEKIKYKVRFEFEGEDIPPNPDTLLPAEFEVLPGEMVHVDDLEDQGVYKFLGWEDNDFKMPKEDVTVTGYWLKSQGLFKPEITLEVVDKKDPYIIGQTVTYKVTVKNNESHPIQDVAIRGNNETIVFPESDQYLLGDNNVVYIEEIAAGDSYSFTYTRLVTNSDPAVLTNEIELIDAWYFDLSTEGEYYLKSGDYTRSESVNIKKDDEEEKVTVTFDPNGGSGEMSPVEVYKGSEFTLPDNGFTAPTDKTFEKWDKGQVEDRITVDSDTKLYANWRGDISHSITVTNDGHGTGRADMERANPGQVVALEDTPNAGYKFKEFQVVSGGVTIEYGEFTMGSEDVVIKVLFEPISTTQYEVKYESNGGSPVATESVYEGTAATKPYDPTKDKNIFDGWYQEDALTNKFDFSTLITGDITLYAKWLPDENENGTDDNTEYRTITYKDGAEGTVFTDVVYDKQLDNLPTPSFDTADPTKEPTRSKFVFAGWSPAVAGTINGDAVYTATWDVDNNEDGEPDVLHPYTVNFDSGGKDWTDAPASQSVVWGNKVTKPSKTPKAENYIFDGWYKEPSFDNAWDFDTEVIHRNTTIYAKWENDSNNNGIPDKDEEFVILFDPNGGNWNGSVEPIKTVYKYGSQITIADAPTREGYEFSYWRGSVHYPGQYYKVIEDHEFTAIWEKQSSSEDDDSEDDGTTEDDDSENDGTSEDTQTDNPTEDKPDKGKPTKGNEKNKDGDSVAAPTGDESRLELFISLFIISLAVLIGLTYITAKKKKNRAKSISCLILAGLIVLSGYPFDISVHADDGNSSQPVASVSFDDSSDENLYTATKEAHWTGYNEAELNVTLDANAMIVPTAYDYVVLVVPAKNCMNNNVYQNDYIFTRTYDTMRDAFLNKGYNVVEITSDNRPDVTFSGESAIPGGHLAQEGCLRRCTLQPYGDNFETVMEEVLTWLNGAYRGDKKILVVYFRTHLQNSVGLMDNSDGPPARRVNKHFSNFTIVRYSYVKKDSQLNKRSVQKRLTLYDSSLKMDAPWYYSTYDTGKINSFVAGYTQQNGRFSYDITDEISQYFYVEDVDSIEVIDDPTATVDMIDSGGKQKILVHSSKAVSGGKVEVKIKLKVKDEYKDYVGLMETNGKIEVKHQFANQNTPVTNETTDTPVLQHTYKVIYDNSTPGGCTLPTTTSEDHVVYDTVEIKDIGDTSVNCQGYVFKGYEVIDDDVQMIGDDYFIMPEHDVTLRAVWGKPSVVKDYSGSSWNRVNATTHIGNMYIAGDTGLAADDPDGNIRYVGANPNNYVTFNNETWRIIGVFDVDDGSGNVEKRLKLIRDESLGNYSYCSTRVGVSNKGYGQNSWPQSWLSWELNSTGDMSDKNIKGYLHQENSGTEQWMGSTNEEGRVEYNRSKNLTTESQNMIDVAKWYLFSPNLKTEEASILNTMRAADVYQRERETGSLGKVCSSGQYCNDTWGSASSWNGKVGLIYPSDYKYAEASGGNWLYMAGEQHTISPSAHADWATSVISIKDGVFKWANASDASATKPCVYLKAGIYFESGSGTSSDPYTLEPLE